MSALPEAYLAIVRPLIATARGFLEAGESLVPVAFVGNFASGQAVPCSATPSVELRCQFRVALASFAPNPMNKAPTPPVAPAESLRRRRNCCARRAPPKISTDR